MHGGNRVLTVEIFSFQLCAAAADPCADPHDDDSDDDSNSDNLPRAWLVGTVLATGPLYKARTLQPSSGIATANLDVKQFGGTKTLG